jgi:hypothetical protein
MPLLAQGVWHIDRRVSVLAIVKYQSMLDVCIGILAIALSRLRMTVQETIAAFESILNAMYAKPRNVVPLATKYKHVGLETSLASIARKHCKQHESGLCSHEEDFQWRSAGHRPSPCTLRNWNP